MTGQPQIIVDNGVFLLNKKGEKTLLDEKYIPTTPEEADHIESARFLAEVQLRMRELEMKYGEEIRSDRWIMTGQRNMLHYDAFFGILGGVKLLAKHSYKQFFSMLNRIDRFGFTPLDYAEQQGHTEIVELFKQHGGKRAGEVAYAEHARRSNRTKEGLGYARQQGVRLGRPPGKVASTILDARKEEIDGYLRMGLNKTAISKLLGCSRMTLHNWLKKEKNK